MKKTKKVPATSFDTSGSGGGVHTVTGWARHRDGYWERMGRECTVTLEPRPRYCDRGNFVAKVFPWPGTKLLLDLDHQDGWPRYYFDETRAKLEIEAWLKKRGQL